MCSSYSIKHVLYPDVISSLALNVSIHDSFPTLWAQISYSVVLYPSSIDFCAVKRAHTSLLRGPYSLKNRVTGEFLLEASLLFGDSTLQCYPDGPWLLISGTVQLDRFTDAFANCVILSLIALRLQLLFCLSDILSRCFLDLLQLRDRPYRKWLWFTIRAWPLSILVSII
jgi:hypothetical protein